MESQPLILKLPKSGNTEQEYEDAAAKFFYPDGSIRLAVSDGATETSFSREWALRLVRAYCGVQAATFEMPLWLNRIRRWWKMCINTNELPWYAEEKLRQGAYASLLGITLFPKPTGDGHGSWHAIAIGDSCLFQLRDRQLISKWPLSQSDQFNSRPKLLPSNDDSIEPTANLFFTQNGEWEDQDVFLLMTDAIACWFLRSVEQERLADLAAVLSFGSNSQQEFAAWIDQLRSDGQMRNDDVTLVRFVIS